MKYESVYNQVKDDILAGGLPPGEKLPSLREAAGLWQCDKLTVKKAYARLEREGLITMEVGKGSFIKFPETAHTIPAVQGGYNFYTAYISEGFLPVAEVENIMHSLLKQEQLKLFASAPVGGDDKLREILGARYNVSPRRMVIISGAQQGLGLGAKLFQVNVGESFLFEDPTYSGALSLFKPKHFVPLCLENHDGPVMERLEEIVKGEKIEVFYTIPGIHNPTGIVFSQKKREQVARLAEQYNFYILEDDYLTEFLPPELSDTSGLNTISGHPDRFIDLIPERTIYVKSLSKVTSPGMRIGFLVCPEPLHDAMMFHKFTADIGTSILLQKIMFHFIDNGLLDKHIEYCKSIIHKRRSRIVSLLKDYPYISLPGRQYGYNMWLKSDCDLEINGPPWAGGENFSFNPEFRRCFRLSLMSMDEAAFEQGCGQLDFLFSSLHRRCNTTPVL